MAVRASTVPADDPMQSTLLLVTARAPRRAFATAALGAMHLALGLELTLCPAALPAVRRELGATRLYPWLFVAYLLASTAVVPLLGRLADRLGRRPVFLGGVAVQLTGALLCAVAPSVPVLVLGRALQGAGAGVLAPTATTLTGDLYSLEERSRVQGVFTGAWALGSLSGPLLGAWFTAHASWRWSFLALVPASALAAALLVAAAPEATPTRTGRLDLRPGAAAAVASVAFLLALERGAGPFARCAWGALALGAVVLVLRLQRSARDPLVPPSVAAEPLVRAGALACAVAGALIHAATVYVPLWVAREAGAASHAGSALVPLFAGWALGSTAYPAVMVHLGARATAAVGFVVAGLGAMGLALSAGLDPGAGAAMAALGALGLGVGPAANALVLGAQLQVEARVRAGTTAVLYAARTLGGAVGVAAAGTLDTPEARFAALGLAAWGAAATLALTARSR